MVSGVPGFQSFASTAKAGSGLFQFNPDDTVRGLARHSTTTTRPVNDWSSTALSKVRVNDAGLGSAAGATAAASASMKAARERMTRLS
jgi:hypothetical protein